MTDPDYRVWLIATLKGGVRKSTTAMMLAAALARAGHEPMVIDADLGTQGVTDWASRVYAAGDELPFHVFQWSHQAGLLVPFITGRQAEVKASHVIIDVGGEQPEVIKQAAVLAARRGRVISPIGPEQAELGRVSATRVILADSDAPMAVLLTRVPRPGAGAARGARDSLTGYGYRVLDTEIPQDRDRYAHVWGYVPSDLGAYEQLASELLAADTRES